MEKTIKIDGQEVRLNNNVGWTMIYKDQFGQDIVPVIMPALASIADVLSGALRNAGDSDEIDVRNMLKTMDGDALLNAEAHLSALEFVDFVNIVWSLAKCADDSIPDPKTWIKRFGTFEVDVIGPEVFDLVVKGVISSKNLRRLKSLKETLQPRSSSIQSSSQDSNED